MVNTVTESSFPTSTQQKGGSHDSSTNLCHVLGGSHGHWFGVAGVCGDSLSKEGQTNSRELDHLLHHFDVVVCHVLDHQGTKPGVQRSKRIGNGGCAHCVSRSAGDAHSKW